MIADDMMTFIKNDIVVFGAGVFLFIIATLWFVFRSLINLVPLSCFFSFYYDRFSWLCRMESYSYILKFYCSYVNLTMAMNIHMSVRYLQFRKKIQIL